MAKVKVTTNFALVDLLDQFVDQATGNEIGEAIVEEAKQMISEGQSPVRGYGRFEAYKDRTQYPGKLKPARPVNLNLKGEMLQGYGYRLKSYQKQGIVEVGMVRGSPERKKIASFHNDGTDVMAQRKIVPGEDEEWAVSIMRKLRDIYQRRLNLLIRQSNKKS